MHLPPAISLPAAACVAASLAAVVSAWGVFLVRGSTAVPAAFWSVAACLALAVEMWARAAWGLAGPVAVAARLAVVSLSLCPAMSLLGAKRPQHGVWQLIVATLAVVLAMPAASALLMRPGSLPDLHLLERCFMPLLVLVGWMNFAGTRRAVAVSCVAAAQLLFLRGFLPGVAMDGAMNAATAGGTDAAAAGLLLIGTLLAAVQACTSRGGRVCRSDQSHTSGHAVAAIIDPSFLALRETLGAAWTLRIAERFDTVATARGWPCRLRFGGLESGGDPLDTFWHRDALRAFRALARRFVSEAWLARHGWHGWHGWHEAERSSPAGP
jgi:hypothetical protein